MFRKITSTCWCWRKKVHKNIVPLDPVSLTIFFGFGGYSDFPGLGLAPTLPGGYPAPTQMKGGLLLVVFWYPQIVDSK